ncbi:hypothetical protein BN1723_020842, partial [Verticillium longisporum]
RQGRPLPQALRRLAGPLAGPHHRGPWQGPHPWPPAVAGPHAHRQGGPRARPPRHHGRHQHPSLRAAPDHHRVGDPAGSGRARGGHRRDG